MASRIEARANPELLVWARETAGFSVGLAAERFKVPPDRLEAWERGETRASVPQLRKIAQLYRRPLAAFYLPRPPAAEEPVHDFRRIHGHTVGRSSPDLLLAIRRHPDFPLRAFVRCESCGRGLTGSWSKGRSEYYAYYHCRPGCRAVNVAKAKLEGLFADELRSCSRHQATCGFSRNPCCRSGRRERLRSARRLRAPSAQPRRYRTS